MGWDEVVVRLSAVFLLIAINAFFVAAEFAIVAVRKSRIDHLVREGDLQASTIQSLQQSLDRLLSSTQLGITLSSLALGWIGEATVALLVQSFFVSLPLPVAVVSFLSHSLAIPIAFLLLVYVQIILGELCPKSVALLYPEKVARFLAPPVSVVSRIFNPLVGILNNSTRFLLKLFGVEYTGGGWYTRVTPEELQLIITTEKDSSGLEEEERELLSNVLEFCDVQASEIMTPRVKIKAIDLSATCGELLQKVKETKHSLYPVIGESLDDIRGIVDVKDLLSLLADNPHNLDIPIEDYIKPVRFLGESTLLSELLTTMQQSRMKMVIIVDEYGGTSGLVTMQDLIDQIFGGNESEIEDDDNSIRVVDEQNFIVSAQINLEELNDLLDLNLPIADDYQTLGGFLVYHWQKIPKANEVFHFDHLQFTILDVDGPRINKIKITIQDSEQLPPERLK
ncbi:MAG: hemolysin family protein [Geminocystis sp.]|nr:hemolysin family protein [Geminocystis sp.]HIK37005.1 HlyC/CorC family transporter [Geminocystis sp. M7585_C2015_104]MCS7148077.1 hemolysin family protein [Geminocystis sp.]MCX8077821.1 hemolysin family protein [Geminocystis sp.]MDW8116429.1 hemolysin family protein [Geminocystis sp.]